MMEYKGYIGKVEFDDEASLFHGEVAGTRDVITFQGKSAAELKRAFRESIDDYLNFCAERGETPDKPFSGQFVTRVSPELHRQASMAASRAGKSLNAWVADQLKLAIEDGDVAAPRRRTTSKKPVKKPRRSRSA
jgi:predicted HicB family RNase H-like nuclease